VPKPPFAGLTSEGAPPPLFGGASDGMSEGASGEASGLRPNASSNSLHSLGGISAVESSSDRADDLLSYLLNSPRGVQMSQLLASPALGSKQAQELDPSDRVTVSDAMAAFHARTGAPQGGGGLAQAIAQQGSIQQPGSSRSGLSGPHQFSRSRRASSRTSGEWIGDVCV